MLFSDSGLGGAFDSATSTSPLHEATSRDSTRAYVLTNTAFGSILSTYDISSRSRVGNQLNLSGGAAGVTLSPLGRLYVTAINRIYEITSTGITLALTQNGEISTAGTLGPLKFTPDGLSAYVVNSTPSIGGSLLKFTTATRGLASWPPFPQTPPLFSDIYIAGNDRIFAYSPQTSTLYDVVPAPFGAAESALSSVVGNQIRSVLGVAVSSEVPNAKYLFLMIGNFNAATIYRIDLSNNTQSLQVLSTLITGTLNFVSVPLQSAGAFYLLNNFQVLQPNTTSLPLIARVLDSANRPVFNVPVTFSNANPLSTAVITTPSSVTDSDGYVQTTVTAPAEGGNYIINIAASGATSSFTIQVPGAGEPPVKIEPLH